MSISVPRAPRLQEDSERVRRLRRLQGLVRQQGTRGPARLLVPLAGVLAGLGALMLLLALMVAFAPESLPSQAVLGLLSPGRG